MLIAAIASGYMAARSKSITRQSPMEGDPQNETDIRTGRRGSEGSHRLADLGQSQQAKRSLARYVRGRAERDRGLRRRLRCQGRSHARCRAESFYLRRRYQEFRDDARQRRNHAAGAGEKCRIARQTARSRKAADRDDLRLLPWWRAWHGAERRFALCVV